MSNPRNTCSCSCSCPTRAPASEPACFAEPAATYVLLPRRCVQHRRERAAGRTDANSTRAGSHGQGTGGRYACGTGDGGGRGRGGGAAHCKWCVRDAAGKGNPEATDLIAQRATAERCESRWLNSAIAAEALNGKSRPGSLPDAFPAVDNCCRCRTQLRSPYLWKGGKSARRSSSLCRARSGSRSESQFRSKLRWQPFQGYHSSSPSRKVGPSTGSSYGEGAWMILAPAAVGHALISDPLVPLRRCCNGVEPSVFARLRLTWMMPSRLQENKLGAT